MSSLGKPILSVVVLAVLTMTSSAMAEEASAQVPDEWLMSLDTDTPAEGFALAVRLAQRGVTTTQPDRSVLHAERPKYSRDAGDLIAASHVVAVHFQTIAAANDYWRD